MTGHSLHPLKLFVEGEDSKALARPMLSSLDTRNVFSNFSMYFLYNIYYSQIHSWHE